MLDDELRERLADWVRPVTAVAIPDIRVLRRRARRRRMRRAATAAAVTAAVAAVVAGVTAALPDQARPAQDHPASPTASPLHWPKAPGTWHPDAWRAAGPLPAADAAPASAPYIVRLLPSLRNDAQVRNMFTGQTIQTIRPPAGRSFGAITAAGDGRTFVLLASVGASQNTPVPVNPTSFAFYEMRLRPDGHLESLSVLGTVPAQRRLTGFAVSPDASMLAYSIGNGFETVSLSTGTGKRWPGVDAGGVPPLSLSWAGDRTLAFEWDAGADPHQPGTGVRLLDVAAPGNILQASRLVVGLSRYCPGSGCRSEPAVTADGSKVLVTRVVQHGTAGPGSHYTSSVAEYSVRTGELLAMVTPPSNSGWPASLCVALWSSPDGGRVVSFCGGSYLRYDHGHLTPITIHPPRYGTNMVAFAWVGSLAAASSVV